MSYAGNCKLFERSAFQLILVPFRHSLSASVKAQRLFAGLERTVEFLVSIATALVLWRGVQLVLHQVLTPGDLLVFVNYLRIAFKPMRQLAKYTGQIAKATASGERVLDVLDTVR